MKTLLATLALVTLSLAAGCTHQSSTRGPMIGRATLTGATMCPSNHVATPDGHCAVAATENDEFFTP